MEIEEVCDVVTVLETHNKQPEDSLQQNRYIYLLCVIMTPHTAYPVCDFSYKRCCIKLKTKPCPWLGRRCEAARRLWSHQDLDFWGAEQPDPRAGAVHWHRVCPHTHPGPAARDLTGHRDQSTRRMVSPKLLLKHCTDDGGCSENTKHPKVERKVTVAAGECCEGAQRMPAPHCAVVWGLLGNQDPGPFLPLDEARGFGSVFPSHSTPAFGGSDWQGGEADKAVASAGFLRWVCCEIKKYQWNQGGERNQNDQSDPCKI